MSQITPFRFRLTDECKQQFATLRKEVEELANAIRALDESEADLLQPVFERFFGILDSLSNNLVLVEGYGNIEVTGAKK